MKKKIVVSLGIIATFAIIFIVIFTIFNSNKTENAIEGTRLSNGMLLSNAFPDIYQPYIDELKKK